MADRTTLPIRVVAAVLVRDHTVLAAQRAPGAHQEMLWEFPGGKVEPGESDPEALMRELQEELGISVQVDAEVARTVHTYPHAQIELIALRCFLPVGEPQALEHHALKWVTIHEGEQLNWAPADQTLWRNIRRQLN